MQGTGWRSSASVTLLLGLGLGCGGEPGALDTGMGSENLIYGADDRRDVYQVTNAQELALVNATVALLDARDIAPVSGGYEISTSQSFASAYRLCSSEPYRTQPSTAFCSGFLVAPDTIATAGHCIDSATCGSTYFAFGFHMLDSATVRSRVATSEVYRCAQVIARVNSGTNDFAVVRLDRSVQGHAPIAFRTSGTVPVNTPLVIAGHPAGIPLKVAGGATVRSNSAGNYFEANLDSYGGNSGSPVMNASTGVVEGILVRGNTDFRKKGRCYVSNTCSDGGCPGWEDATRVTNIAPYVSTTPQCQSDADCDDANPCNGAESCAAGVCQSGAPVDCADAAGACTTDACVPTGATTYTCSHTAVTCDDGDPCTVDFCDAVTGCGQTPLSCPSGEVCSAGQCVAAPQCAPARAACSSNSDCCSNNCHWKKRTCR